MRKLLLLFSFISIIGCSTEDDCVGDYAEIKAQYEAIMDNDQLSAEQRNSLKKQYEERLEKACS